MKSPFWHFFCYYREQSPTPLAIDQYYYFLKAWENLPLAETLTDLKEVQGFCKLFWLQDGADENHFDQIFKQFVQWGAWMKSEPKAIKELATKTGAAAIDDGDSEPKPIPSVSGTKPDKTSPKEEKTKEAIVEGERMVDFELIISDSSGVDSGKVEVFEEHPFVLQDQAIMPFDLRSFSQRLRRLVETAVYEYTEKLHVEAMIEKYSKQGYIETFTYERKNASNSNIVLLADRDGSMLAYEYWEQQLELAFRGIPSCQFEHYYYFQLPDQNDQGPHYRIRNARKRRKLLQTDCHKWTNDTWFFIFSDAGAHSGIVDRDRVKGSLNFWFYLKGISQHVYWLNPVPNEFQEDCTSKRLTFCIPMIYPDQEGLFEITNRHSNE